MLVGGEGASCSPFLVLNNFRGREREKVCGSRGGVDS